jgi:hypothetical protein
MAISYIKLYGPSIFKGQQALENLIEDFGKKIEYGDMILHVVSVINPSLDLLTGELFGGGQFTIGEYDFAFEWKESPSKEQVKKLIQRIDDALLYTGCRYTITTKK